MHSDLDLGKTGKNGILSSQWLEPNTGMRLLAFLFIREIMNHPKEGLLAVRELRCADLMAGCNFVAQGKDDSEVMKKAAAHAKSAHKMAALSMEVEKKARAAIRDAGAFEPGGPSKT